MRKLFLSILLSCFMILGVCAPALSLPVGSEPPDFALKDLDGKTVRLSDYRGRPILLKIGSTNCGSCVMQSEAIADTGKFLKENGVVVLEVFLQSSVEQIKQYLKGEHYPMTFVPLIGDEKVHRAYNVFTIPRVLFIDCSFHVTRDGSVITPRGIIKEVKKLVGPKEGSKKETKD